MKRVPEFTTRVGVPVLLCAVLVLGGCTTSPKVAVTTQADATLSCAGLADELASLDQMAQKARNAKGTTGKNVIGAVLWLPGYVYTQNDADRALRLIAQRRAHLESLARKKGCS